MKVWQRLIALIIIVTTPTHLLFPYSYSPINNVVPMTKHFEDSYDGFLEFLDALENDELEKNYPACDVQSINQFLVTLATEGILPGEDDLQETLNIDIASLPTKAPTHYSELIVPAASYQPSSIELFLCQSWASKQWKQTKAFVKKHKKAIIIGAVVVLVVTAMVLTATYSAAAGTAGGGGVAATKAAKNSDAFKDFLATDGTFSSGSMSPEEKGRIIGPLYAHDKATTSEAHNAIDETFATNYSTEYLEGKKDLNLLLLQKQGEAYLQKNQYNEAKELLTKAINVNPSEPDPYLYRSVSFFCTENYDSSITDFNAFSARSPPDGDLLNYSSLFAKGLGQGAKQAGGEMWLFVTDLATKPIHTLSETTKACNHLVSLARSGEWEELKQALQPEIYRVISNWDKFSPKKRSLLLGHALGKHGADFLLPGSTAKIAKKTAKAIKAAQAGLRKARGIAVLEGVSQSGTTLTKKAVEDAKKAKHLFETQGIHPSKTKKNLKLGANKHGKWRETYQKRSSKEIQKGVRSLKKQIEIHKDKIANPKKYCPDWDSFRPERKKALVEKLWPSEIQKFEEQKIILNDILMNRKP